MKPQTTRKKQVKVATNILITKPGNYMYMYMLRTNLKEYLDDASDNGELGKLNCAEDLYSLIEEFLYVAE